MKHLKIHGTVQTYYKISPSHPLKAQHPLEVSQKAPVAHLSSPTTKQWARREGESRCISNPSKPLFSWLGTPNDLDTAYQNWLQNPYCGLKLLKSFMPVLAQKGNCQCSELLSWKSKLRTSLWAAARPAVTSQTLSSICNRLTWAAPRIQIHCTMLSKQITKYQAAPQRRQKPRS